MQYNYLEMIWEILACLLLTDSSADEEIGRAYTYFYMRFCFPMAKTDGRQVYLCKLLTTFIICLPYLEDVGCMGISNLSFLKELLWDVCLLHTYFLQDLIWQWSLCLMSRRWQKSIKISG